MSKLNKKQQDIFIIPDDIILWYKDPDGLYTQEALALVIDFLNDVAKRHSIEHSFWGLSFKDRTLDMNQVPYPDMKELHYRDRKIDFKKSPTYLQIWKACDKLIKKSGDNHHNFIEDFLTHDVPCVYHLETAS